MSQQMADVNETETVVSEPIDLRRVRRHRESRVKIDLSLAPKVTFKWEGKENTFTLTDVSAFGFRAVTAFDELTFRSSDVFAAVVSVGNYSVFTGPVRVVNEVQMPTGMSFGFMIMQGIIDVDFVKSIIDGQASKSFISGTSKLIESFGRIRPEFKGAVADLCAVLKDLESKFRSEEKLLLEKNLGEAQRHRVQQAIVDLALSLYGPVLGDMFLRFEKIIADFTSDEHGLHKNYFRAIFSEVVVGTPFFSRAFEKPLGYAGDYGLMLMFYNYSDVGHTLFHRFMHRWACNQPAAVANRNRVEYLAMDLATCLRANEGSEFKISSIACGPAQELSLFLEQCELPPGCDLTINLVDQESEALDYAISNTRKHMRPDLKIRVNAFKEDAVLGLIKGRPFSEEIEGSNVIISAGLFDYLSDRVSTKLIEVLFRRLKPGGRLIIGNVSQDNPDRFAMDYMMEWTLVLRNRFDLMGLVPEGVKHEASRIDVQSEALGLNLFLILEK